MKTPTRLAIISASALVCATGVFIAQSGPAKVAISEVNINSLDAIVRADGYQFAAARTPKLTFQQLETLVRLDPVAKSQRGRIEFGSVRIEEGGALAEVMFVSNDGRVQPFLYKLLPERNLWKIVNVQRLWFVPRSRLLRGVRV